MIELRFWKLFSILLITLNIVLLSVLWLGIGYFKQGVTSSFPDRRTPLARDFLIKQVGFNVEQTKQYDILITLHRDSMQRMTEVGRLLRDSLFQATIGDKPKQESVSKYLDAIGENQKQIESITYNHLIQVKRICNEAQKIKFDSAVNEFLSLLKHAPGNKDDFPPRHQQPPPENRLQPRPEEGPPPPPPF